MTQVPNAVLAPGILTLETTTATTLFQTGNVIPIQTITLRAVRIEFDTATNAVAAKTLFLDLPFLSDQQLVDGIVGRFNLPIFCGDTAITLRTDLNIPVYLSKIIPDTFYMYIRTGDGALAANLVKVSAMFTYDYTSLTH